METITQTTTQHLPTVIAIAIVTVLATQPATIVVIAPAALAATAMLKQKNVAN